jgi:hypothetical protein
MGVVSRKFMVLLRALSKMKPPFSFSRSTLVQWLGYTNCDRSKEGCHVRLCNPALDVDQYPLPCPTDFVSAFTGGKYFTKLDLSHTYNQMRTCGSISQSIHIGDFTFAVWCCLRSCIIPENNGHYLGVICYIDDIMVTGKIQEEHMERLKKVLQRLREHGIQVKLSKSGRGGGRISSTPKQPLHFWFKVAASYG